MLTKPNENKQKLAFSTPPPKSADVIYEWSLYKVIEIILFFYLAATDDFDEQGVDWL